MTPNVFETQEYKFSEYQKCASFSDQSILFIFIVFEAVHPSCFRTETFPNVRDSKRSYDNPNVLSGIAASNRAPPYTLHMFSVVQSPCILHKIVQPAVDNRVPPHISAHRLYPLLSWHTVYHLFVSDQSWTVQAVQFHYHGLFEIPQILGCSDINQRSISFP